MTQEENKMIRQYDTKKIKVGDITNVGIVESIFGEYDLEIDGFFYNTLSHRIYALTKTTEQ